MINQYIASTILGLCIVADIFRINKKAITYPTEIRHYYQLWNYLYTFVYVSALVYFLTLNQMLMFLSVIPLFIGGFGLILVPEKYLQIVKHSSGSKKIKSKNGARLLGVTLLLCGFLILKYLEVIFNK